MSKTSPTETANAEMKRTGTMFFIMIPVCIFLLAFVYDIALVQIQEARVKKITENVVTEVLTTNVNDYRERVQMLYEKNSITTDHLEVSFDGNVLTIYNIHVYPSFFARLMAVDHYRVETSIKAHLVGEAEVVIEEVDPDKLQRILIYWQLTFTKHILENMFFFCVIMGLR